MLTNWKDRASPRQALCAGLSPTTERPSNMTSPASGGWRPANVLTKVVFPAPFGPTIAMISPLLTSKDTSFNAVNFPYFLVSSRARSSISI